MTRDEAQDLFTRIGCMDPRNVACAHVAYCHWIERKGRTEDPLQVAEAYGILSKKEPPKVTQAALFTEKGADL